MSYHPSHEMEGKIMRRILSLLAAGVLSVGMAAAQTSAPSTPPAQDTNQSATNPDRTSKAGAGQNADAARTPGQADNTPAPGTNGTSANHDAATAGKAGSAQNGDAATAGQSGADQNGDAARTQSADASDQTANNQQPAKAKTSGGIPWLWIALG